MRVAVAFQDEQLAFEVPDDRLIGVWHGPGPIPRAEVKGLVLEALEHPLGFPPLRQAVVPGDRVVIPIDPQVPEATAILEALRESLEGAGVDVLGPVDHGFIRSIYFYDPSGHRLELTVRTHASGDLDRFATSAPTLLASWTERKQQHLR